MSWRIDRRFEGWVLFEDWLENHYRFVDRLVGKRYLLRFSGDSPHSKGGQWVPMRAKHPANQVPTPYRFDKLIKRRGRPALRITQIGWTKVRLPKCYRILNADENLQVGANRVSDIDLLEWLLP